MGRGQAVVAAGWRATLGLRSGGGRVPTEWRLTELSEAGEGVWQAGEPGGCRFGARGAGDPPFTETGTPLLRGRGIEVPSEKCQVWFA